jgi:hypothetical protein
MRYMAQCPSCTFFPSISDIEIWERVSIIDIGIYCSCKFTECRICKPKLKWFMFIFVHLVKTYQQFLYWGT